MSLLPQSSGFPCIRVRDYNQGRVYVWYSLEGIQGQPRIQIRNMTEEEIEYSENHSIEEVHRYLHPGWNEEGVVGVDTLNLQKKTVSILIQEPDLDGWMRISFVYDNMHVLLSFHEDDFDAIDWTQFSLRTE